MASWFALVCSVFLVEAVGRLPGHNSYGEETCHYSASVISFLPIQKKGFFSFFVKLELTIITGFFGQVYFIFYYFSWDGRFYDVFVHSSFLCPSCLLLCLFFSPYKYWHTPLTFSFADKDVQKRTHFGLKTWFTKITQKQLNAFQHIKRLGTLVDQNPA